MGRDELLEAVRRVLRAWDPIGVRPGVRAPLDEYDSYAPGVLALMEAGADKPRLTDHLGQLCREAMGLPADADRDDATARALLDATRPVGSPTGAPSGEVLSEEARKLLELGTGLWGGPEYGADLVASMLGLPDEPSLHELARSLRRSLRAWPHVSEGVLWRALLLTEVLFASDVAGMGRQWATVSGWSDQKTLEVMRDLQRHMSGRRSPGGEMREPHSEAAVAHAALRVSGTELDPLTITEALRLPPDRAHRRGEPRLSWSASRERVIDRGSHHHRGLWLLSTKGRVRSRHLATHVRWLLRMVAPKADVLRTIAARHDADIFCYLRAPHAPSMPGELREEAVAMGLFIDIDHDETKGARRTAEDGIHLPLGKRGGTPREEGD